MYTIVPFRRAFDSAFAPLFNDHFMREFFDASNAPEMRVDVREKEDAFLLEADLPGVKKEDISLDVNDGVLTSIRRRRKPRKAMYATSAVAAMWSGPSIWKVSTWVPSRPIIAMAC